MDSINNQHTITISEFYKKKNIFITGATGFLGKVLIEKLLRSCPDVGNIYILMRPKKEKTLQERLHTLLEDALFDTLKFTQPDKFLKLIPLKGDCSQLSLRLSPSDYSLLIKSISVIYHMAASVRFDDFLQDAILLNIRGTREIVYLALQIPNLSALVHVSTSFCNSTMGKEIEEKLYPPPADWKEVIEIGEKTDRRLLTVLTNKYLGPYPNTYTFTKALAEHVVNDLCKRKVKTVICRPSIVTSTLNDPVKGWIDNFNGSVGLFVASAKGLLRCMYMDPNLDGHYIPVDMTVKSMIAASWDVALKPKSDAVDIIHCTTGDYKWITNGKAIVVAHKYIKHYPFNNTIWVPKGYVSKCVYYAFLCTILFHLVPAAFLDLCLLAMGKKPILLKLQKKIYNAGLQLRYFSTQEWVFYNKNFLTLEKKLLKKDRPNWAFDFESIDTEDFLKNCIVGAKKYLLKEDDATLPQAKVHYKRMYWLDKFTMLILYGSIFLLILYFNLFEKLYNRFY